MIFFRYVLQVSTVSKYWYSKSCSPFSLEITCSWITRCNGSTKGPCPNFYWQIQETANPADLAFTGARKYFSAEWPAQGHCHTSFNHRQCRGSGPWRKCCSTNQPSFKGTSLWENRFRSTCRSRRDKNKKAEIKSFTLNVIVIFMFPFQFKSGDSPTPI